MSCFTVRTVCASEYIFNVQLYTFNPWYEMLNINIVHMCMVMAFHVIFFIGARGSSKITVVISPGHFVGTIQGTMNKVIALRELARFFYLSNMAHFYDERACARFFSSTLPTVLMLSSCRKSSAGRPERRVLRAAGLLGQRVGRCRPEPAGPLEANTQILRFLLPTALIVHP